jgi:hypothetical protein
MSEKAPRIEPQYLQAAAQQAATYYSVIWQKMGYVLAIQYGSIAAAYVLRSTWLGAFVMGAAFLFSWGLVWAIEHDVKNREILIFQVNYIARGLQVVFAEHAVPAGLRVPFELEPISELDHIPGWARPTLLRLRQYLTWLHIRLAILLAVDFVIATTLKHMPPP